MSAPDLFVGLDLGTTGARAIAIDAAGAIHGQASARLDRFGMDHRDPGAWWAAVDAALTALGQVADLTTVRRIAVDATSGTVLPIDGDGAPLATPLMYNDAVDDRVILEAIARLAPATSAAHGATSGLAKALRFQPLPAVRRIVHQADWIVGRLCGRYDVTDENNALKTGYDPIARLWPDWMAATGVRLTLLPEVVPVSTAIAPLRADVAALYGFAPDAMVVAGTTDGCASFLATGADTIGDGVTALGTTLTLKLLSDQPIFAPSHGIYSHRIGDRWLAGGASNSGGNVLAALFEPGELARLQSRLDPARPTGLDYYPLLRPGERFPINDPDLPPRLEPRPDDRATFLQAILEGIAGIEALGYQRLADLGGPTLASIRTVGGGAANAAWTDIRTRRLAVPVRPARSDEAAYGSARLALADAGKAGPA